MQVIGRDAGSRQPQREIASDNKEPLDSERCVGMPEVGLRSPRHADNMAVNVTAHCPGRCQQCSPARD